MQNGKDKPPSYLNYRKLLVFLVFSLLLGCLISLNEPFWITQYQVGDIAPANIKAPEDTYVPALDVTVKKGEIVVREGERIREEHLQRLSAFHDYNTDGFFPVTKFLALFLLLFLSLAILYEFADRNIKKFSLSQKDIIFCSVLTLFTALFVKFCSVLFQHFTPNHADALAYIVPVFFFGMILRIVLFSEVALVFAIYFALTMGFATESNVFAVLYLSLGNILSSYFSGRCENRNTILKAGLYTSLIMSLIFIVSHLFMGHPLSDLPLKVVFILLSGIGSSFISLGLLPVIEHVFDYTTDIKLLELANLENKLLDEMMTNAPGTYHHSLIAGNLSKAAAESIGANPLLARVSAYYHDIGKLKMPHYFIENRRSFVDAHKSLTPNMSALIILSHVKEGIDLADRYKLGSKLKDIIRQHHGTSLVSYFYKRAKEVEEPSLHVTEEKDFRYPGPKPQTKEAGIVMLADAVEAASRTLEDPTPKRVENLVQNIIERIFLDGQLDECELTLKDLNAIQQKFTTILTGIFHQRIEYPEKTDYDSAHKKLSKTA
jgi:putative nucleotidyltransferase with HDIG domain